MTFIFQHISTELFLRYMFMGIIFLPLPILLFHGIITSIFQMTLNRMRYKNIKKHYENMELVTLLQLQQLYPGKNEKMLEDMLDAMNEMNYHIKNRIDIRVKKKSGKVIGTMKKFQPEKVQIYPVMPVFITNW